MGGITSQGATLQLAAAAIANVTAFGFDGQEVEEIDVTHLGSTGGGREFIGGFRDAGTITAELLWDGSETSHIEVATGLKRYYNTSESLAFTATDANADTYTGNCWVKSLTGPSFAVGEPMTATVTLRLTGVTTFPS